MTAAFELRGVGMRYGEVWVLREASLKLAAGEITAIVGPNGAGKSTLVGIMAGLRPRYAGRCLFEGVEVSRWARRAFARRVSFVPQSFALQFPFTAEQVVMMGRTPYCDGLFESSEDRAAVERAMEITDTLAFRSRDFRSLSGGERQRVVLASALAQSPRALLVDEPTTFLDLKHQVSIYRILRQLAREGLLVVVVTHDLNLAAAYTDRVVTMTAGRLTSDGPPGQVLTAGAIREVFGVEAEVREGPAGRPWFFYGD